MSALQVRPVAAVAPVIFAIELGVPVVLGPLVGGESWPTDPARLAVELDRAIVKKTEWPATPVSAGARLEIVQFVGGG